MARLRRTIFDSEAYVWIRLETFGKRPTFAQAVRKPHAVYNIGICRQFSQYLPFGSTRELENLKRDRCNVVNGHTTTKADLQLIGIIAQVMRKARHISRCATIEFGSKILCLLNSRDGRARVLVELRSGTPFFQFAARG